MPSPSSISPLPSLSPLSSLLPSSPRFPPSPSHVILQRQQKRVAEENTFYFDLIQKALPQEETKLAENGNGRERTGSGAEDVAQGSANSGEQKQKVSPKASSKLAQKTQVVASPKHGRSNSGAKNTDQRATSVTKPDQNLPSGATPPVANGDVVRPSSASKVHLPTGKKQATVKAVPRNEPPAPPTDLLSAAEKDKVCATLGECFLSFFPSSHTCHAFYHSLTHFSLLTHGTPLLLTRGTPLTTLLPYKRHTPLHISTTHQTSYTI